MEKITKALIEEINDITSYSDLIKLQKLIDVVINNDFRNSEKIRSAVAETKNKINTTELKNKENKSYRPLDFKRLSDPDYNPYARKPQKEIEEDEGILEVEYEDPEQEIKKETRGRKPKK